jgi:hypothetical protein
MAWNDPLTVQDPTTNVVALHGWGDAVNESFNFLRGAKAGCHLTSVVGTAITTDTQLPWGTELYDVNACHDTGSNTERITVPTGWGGLWFIGCLLRCTNNVFHIMLVVNDTTRIAATASSVNGNVESSKTVETIYPLAAGDYVEVWATNGGNRSTSVASHFYAHWIASGN